MNIKEILLVGITFLVFGWVGAVITFAFIVSYQMLSFYIDGRDARQSATYRWIR